MTATEFSATDAASARYGDAVALGDFVALLKPRVMSLVVFTGVVGMLLAPGALHPVLAIVAILCIAVGAGAAGAINMWYDRDLDALMTRTRNRPIPAGRVAPNIALGFGITLAVASVSMMALAVNGVAAGLLAFTIFFYIVIYSMALKRRTPQNIVIGGAAGASDLRYQAVGIVFRTAIVDGDCSALVGEGQANLSAHVPRTARYQGYFAG